MSSPFTVSASQIDTSRACKRRWAWGKIAGIKAPQHPSASLGEDVHGHKERWHKDGIRPDKSRAGKIATAGLDEPPPPGTGDAENKFSFEYGGILWTGRKDLEYRDNDVLVVRDYKSTSQFGYAKTPETLKTDAQGNLYAFETFRRVPDNALLLDWFYLRTSSPAYMRVQLRVIREDVERQMNDVMLPTGQELFSLRRAGVNPLSLPPTTSACHLYPPAGCPYKDLCTDLTDTQRLHSLMKGTRMPKNLAARLAAAQNTTEEAPPPEKPKGPTLAEKVGAARAEGVNPPPRAEVPAATDDGDPSDVAERLARLGVEPKEIATALKDRFSLPDDEIEWIMTHGAGRAVDTPPPAEKPKRTRRTKAEMAAVRGPGVAVVGEDPNDNLSAEGKINAAALSDAAPPAAAGFRLFINAYPVKGCGPTISLAEILYSVNRAIAEETEAVHYKLIEYGKGVGVLNEALRQKLEAEPLDGYTVLLDRNTPEGADVLNLMITKATEVVMGPS